MKAYDVPSHLQDEGSEDCGPVASTMVLDFFGITSNQKEVIEKIPRCNFGTDAFGNGRALMDYGLSVEVVTANPLIFDGDFLRAKPGKQELSNRIEKVKSNEKDEDKRAILGRFIDLIDNGAKLTASIPTETTIIEALDAGKLVWTSTYAKALGKNEGGYHFIVIGGYDKSNNAFLVFNPLQKSRRKSWEKIDEVMFAIHANTLFDYDNGAVLLIGQ